MPLTDHFVTLIVIVIHFLVASYSFYVVYEREILRNEPQKRPIKPGNCNNLYVIYMSFHCTHVKFIYIFIFVCMSTKDNQKFIKVNCSVNMDTRYSNVLYRQQGCYPIMFVRGPSSECTKVLSLNFPTHKNHVKDTITLLIILS